MKRVPDGARSQSSGVPALRRSNVCGVRSMPSSAATACRCSTAFVEPPSAMSTRTAFSKAAGVRMCAAVTPRRCSSTTFLPAAKPRRSRRESPPGVAAVPGSDSPSASVSAAIVLAVPITGQAPPPLQPRSSISAKSAAAMRPCSRSTR